MTNVYRFYSVIFDHIPSWTPATRNTYHKCVCCDRKPGYNMKDWMVYKMRRIIAWACCPECWQEVLQRKRAHPCS